MVQRIEKKNIYEENINENSYESDGCWGTHIMNERERENMHELNEMIYELQYEEVCNQVVRARTLVLESMKQQIEMELAIQTDFLNRSNEKFIKQLKDLGIGEE